MTVQPKALARMRTAIDLPPVPVKGEKLGSASKYPAEVTPQSTRNSPWTRMV
jgi:hypothetical protein